MKTNLVNLFKIVYSLTIIFGSVIILAFAVKVFNAGLVSFLLFPFVGVSLVVGVTTICEALFGYDNEKYLPFTNK